MYNFEQLMIATQVLIILLLVGLYFEVYVEGNGKGGKR